MFRVVLQPLHSTMFLLIREAVIHTESQYLPLHSTMFLLILESATLYLYGSAFFTFHYVSINTDTITITKEEVETFTFHYVSINTGWKICALIQFQISLHSTMFLLIR